MIHVCYTLRDESGRYTKFLGTSMLSMFENTREKVTIHLIHDSTLSHEIRKKLTQIVYKYDQEIIFYNVDELVPNLIDDMKNRLPSLKNFYATIAAMYRLLIPNILPPDVTKVIYLDADTVINLDINEMWQIDLENYPIAAVTACSGGLPKEKAIKIFPPCMIGEVKPEDYFQSGSLIFNLEDTILGGGGRNLFDRCLSVLESKPAVYLDQDALNYLFANNFLKLPKKFSHCIPDIKQYEPDFKTDWHEIFQYNGLTIKPDMKDNLNRLWFEYFMKTPFCTPEAIERLCSGIESNANSKALFWQRIYLTSKQRRIGLCVYPENAEMTANFFGTGELILNARNPNVVSLLSKHIRENFAFIIVANEFDAIRNHLISAGFVEDRDFFNGMIFFIPEWNIYSRIIRQM